MKVDNGKVLRGVRLVRRSLGLGEFMGVYEWRTCGEEIKLRLCPVGFSEVLRITWFLNWRSGKYVQIELGTKVWMWCRGHGVDGEWAYVFPWMWTGCRLLAEGFYGY